VVFKIRKYSEMDRNCVRKITEGLFRKNLSEITIYTKTLPVNLIRIPFRAMRTELDTTLCVKVCQLDMRQVGSFLRVLLFRPPIKLAVTK
jgi:hypothetical protein